MGSRFFRVPAVLGVILSAAMAAHGWTLWEDTERGRSAELGGALKLTGFSASSPYDPFLMPERWSGTGLIRARLNLRVQYSPQWSSELAYEHRAQFRSGTAGLGAGSGALPSFAEAPWRIEQLDWQIAAHGEERFYRHEIDRALVAYTPDWGEIVLGRQAIGLGRGVLFGAIDLFAPFTPLEVDREWRRGVDAFRASYRLSPTSSIEMLAVFGDSWADSALLGRARGYVGNLDGELIFGKRADDELIGTAFSAVVGDAEVHGELAFFHVDKAPPGSGLFGSDHWVAKAVLGSSYTFDVGNGLTLLGEYHYSGFGIDHIEDAVWRLMNPTFQERYLRGDTQILGQHAFGATLAYPINEAWSGTLLSLVSLTDGSGLLSPMLNWDCSRSTSIRATVFLPWGPSPRRGRLTSEYGATPTSLYLQVSTYF